MATIGYSFKELARQADIDFKRVGTPLGAILPYFGKGAPTGWLACTKGAKIRQSDYPDLYAQLTKDRSGPTGNSDIAIRGNFWNTSTLISPTMYIVHNDGLMVTGGFVKDKGTMLYPIIGSIPSDGLLKNTQYYCITDIPLSGNSCYLPDLEGNFIKGYDGSRVLGSFEGDAIRNITGNIGIISYGDDNAKGVFKQISSSTDGCATGITIHRPSAVLGFDTSSVVPTGPENVPKNISLLYIIKAYDLISNPEALAAKVVTDQVNDNTSRVGVLEAHMPVKRYLGEAGGCSSVMVTSSYISNSSLIEYTITGHTPAVHPQSRLFRIPTEHFSVPRPSLGEFISTSCRMDEGIFATSTSTAGIHYGNGDFWVQNTDPDTSLYITFTIRYLA